VVLALLAAIVFAATLTDRGRYFVATHVTHDKGEVNRLLDRVLLHTLADLGVSARARTADQHGPDVANACRVTLPARIPLAEANLAFTRRVRGLGALVWDAVEGRAGDAPSVRITVGSVEAPILRVEFATSQGSFGMHSTHPLVALVLVDVTRETLPFALRFASGTPVDAAVVPGEEDASRLARALAARGVELIARLPMEPKGYPTTRTGPDPILVDMSDREIRGRVNRALKVIEGAAGLSNQMGQLALQDREVMRAVLGVAADRHLFFLEAPTTPDSQCRKVGREVGAAVLRADVTLDARRAPAGGLAAQVDQLALYAARYGRAVGVVRADSLTLAEVRRALPGLAAQGARLVPVSALP
jgi:polysaccharide deacetylase 2 family uncharacterized protein YibQ